MLFLAWSLRSVLHKLRVVVITQAAVVQAAVAVVTTATAVNASLVAQPAVMTVVVLVVVAVLVAASQVVTTVVHQPAVKVKAVLQAVMTVALLRAVTAKVLAASPGLVMQAVEVLLPVLTQAHRAVILHRASRALRSQQAVVASHSSPMTHASVLRVQHADRCWRRFAQEAYVEGLALEGASLFLLPRSLASVLGYGAATIIGLGGICCVVFYIFGC